MFRRPFASGRRVLLAGFGGLLLLILVVGADALLVLRKVRTSDAQVRDLYLRRTHGLDQVRSGIYQSAIVMRDYLLASDAGVAKAQAEKWINIRDNTDAALKYCSSILGPAEAGPFGSLQTEVQAYWKLLDFTVKMQGTDRRSGGTPYFSGELVRRRNAMLDLVDSIDQISARQLTIGDANLNATFDTLRLRLAVMMLTTLSVGVLLAAFTIRRTLTLESELNKRYEEGVSAQQELKELSARLVSAQEEERRAISRELHDEVGQSLSALLMEAGNAAASVPQDSAEVRRHVDSIKKLAEASVNVIRNMTLLLRPSMLDDFGLVPALEWQAREVSKRTGLRVHVAAEEGEAELSEELKTCIYRVVQEALHNCARHSRARNVKVVVKQEPSRIVLSVEDDGNGFDARRVRGLGLVGMEERVNHLGGAFEIESRPGVGTKSRGKSAAGELRAMSIRILLADDHTVMRNGLRLLIERQPNLQVVGEAADGREAVELAASERPDIVIMDIAMPQLNGVEAARQIATRSPQTSVVILSMHSDESYVIRSLKAGARAYLLKDSAEADLIAAIKAIMNGQSFFSPAVRRILKEDYMRQLTEVGAEDSYELLTTREREVLQLVAEGKSNKEVANLFNLSLYTIETHRTHILQKLNLHSVPELILYAVRKGIIS